MFFNVFYLLINVFIIYGINQVIFAVLDVSWTMGLNSDKTSEVFCINIKYLVEKQQILLFFYQIIYFCTTVAQSTKFHENCGCFWRVHPIKPERLLCEVSSNDQIPRKRFCSRGVAWTRLTKSRPNRSHRKRSYSISNIGNMMGCNHLSCVAVDPFAGELWHFEYCPTTTVRQLLIFDHMSVTVVRMQRPLPWQPHFGGHVGYMMGCDQPSFVPIGQLLSVMVCQYFPTWQPSAILNLKKFNIWSCDCHCGPNVL